MIRLECPRCGRSNQLDRLERGAEEFCTNCDFPLYWAVPDDVAADSAFRGAGVLDPSLRRLPGTAGRLDVIGEACPRCSELNRPDARFCNRCGLDFRPPPPLPLEPVVLPAPLPPVEEPPAPEPNHLLLLIAIVVLVLALIALAGIALGLGWLALTLLLVLAALVGLTVVGSYWRTLRVVRRRP